MTKMRWGWLTGLLVLWTLVSGCLHAQIGNMR